MRQKVGRVLVNAVGARALAIHRHICAVVAQDPEQQRDSALAMLTNQFTAVLEMSGLKQDEEGKSRTLYSLRHTAIVAAIRQGVPISIIAPNARTSELMINRFYGSHIKSALEMGSVMIDVIEAKKAKYAKKAEKSEAEK